MGAAVGAAVATSSLALIATGNLCAALNSIARFGYGISNRIKSFRFERRKIREEVKEILRKFEERVWV